MKQLAVFLTLICTIIMGGALVSMFTYASWINISTLIFVLSVIIGCAGLLVVNGEK